MEDGIGIRTPRQAIRILAVLVESGMIYILIGVSYASVHTQGLSRFLFSLQVMSLASIFIFLHFGLGNLSYTFLPVSTQLVVRGSF
jgi:hypothetical protein